MTTLISRTKHTAMVALLIIAGGFVGTGAASADSVQTMKVKFTYNPAASAEQIYADFARTATRACHTFGPQPLELRKQEKRCAADFLEKVVDRLGRADVAQLHRGNAMVASR